MSDTQLTVEIIPNIYPASGCTGTPAQLPHAGIRNTMTIDASVTVDGQTAEKVTLHTPAIDPGISAGGSIVLNGLILPGDYFTDAGTEKGLFAVVGNKLQSGADTRGADGYPTAFDPADTFTKQ